MTVKMITREVMVKMVVVVVMIMTMTAMMTMVKRRIRRTKIGVQRRRREWHRRL